MTSRIDYACAVQRRAVKRGNALLWQAAFWAACIVVGLLIGRALA
jgi:hypothetical protein